MSNILGNKNSVYDPINMEYHELSVVTRGLNPIYLHKNIVYWRNLSSFL